MTTAALMLVTSSCDFSNPLSKTKEPINKALIGKWKSDVDAVEITKGESDRTLTVMHSKPETVNGQTTIQCVSFNGYIAKVDGRMYLHLCSPNKDSGLENYIIGELEINKDSLVFKRINRDYPQDFHADQQGTIGLYKLSTKELMTHVATHRNEPHFYASVTTYNKEPNEDH